MTNWQDNMVDDLRARLEPNEDILGLLLFGSCRNLESVRSEWSDIDILVVVNDDRMDRFFPAMGWIMGFGKLYTYSQSSDEFKSTTRVCFENFKRIDFVITTEEKLARVNDWPSVPFFSGTRILISRSAVVDEIARQEQYPYKFIPATEARFLELVRDFRFKSMLAVYKVVRNDLLIALHLTQDLIRDCCVLEMMLRDRETGTNIHRHGGIGNPFVSELEVTQKPFTAIGILDSINASNEVFENLAYEWSKDYQEKRQLLQDWIEKAKLEILS
jgi:Streptomycin adenylyltransferase